MRSAATCSLDGDWVLTKDGVRTRRPYYDRVLAIGDLSWRDYEAVVEVTFHAFAEPKRVRRRTTSRTQDSACGGRDITSFPDLTRSHWRILHGPDSGKTAYARQHFPVQLNRKYMLRGRVERQERGRTRYSVKIWAAGETEPDQWAVDTVEGAGDFQDGSLLLVAHNTDVTFSRVRVTAPQPLPPFAAAPQ